MRDVAIVAYIEGQNTSATTLSPVEMIVPVVHEILNRANVQRSDIDFWCHGSCDYMTGQPFSFVSAVDALGAWPPIMESHVEMDGAWALYEAWVKIQTGEANTALVFGNGKSSAGDMNRALTLQLDPYVVAPLWPGFRSLEAMGARAAIDAGTVTERQMADVVARSLRDAADNPNVLAYGYRDADELLDEPMTANPLRAHDCPAMADGVAAIIMTTADRALEMCDRPAWIRGIDHRIDFQNLGLRDLSRSNSAALASYHAGVTKDKVDVAELHATYSHHEIILAQSMGIDRSTTRMMPSGGALVANPLMAAGLARFGQAARQIFKGDADRAVAHAAQGACLQQNIVAVLEGN